MRARLMDRVATIVLTLIAALIIGTLIGLLGFILTQGWHKLNLDFLTSPPDIVNAGAGLVRSCSTRFICWS